MLRFYLGKAAQYGLVLFAAISLNFALPRLMPGNPLGYLLGESASTLSGAERERILAELGIDAPLPEQFGRYWSRLVQGDLGYSYARKRPVAQLVGERLPWTLALTGLSLLLATLVGIVLGAVAAWRRGPLGQAFVGVALLLESLPAFWLAMVLIALFAVELRLLPSYGAYTAYARKAGVDWWLDVGRHLVLPVATLTLVSVPAMLLTMRASLLQTLGEPYIQVARAKGLPERGVLWRHAARNALLPVATLFLLNAGFAFGGATVTETVFTYPGLGRLLFEAVLARDYPLIQGAFLVITTAVVAANGLADLAYPLLDPRIRRA